MVIRVSLILAILAGFAVAGVNVSRVKQKITNLQSNLTTQTAARQNAEIVLANRTHLFILVNAKKQGIWRR